VESARRKGAGAPSPGPDTVNSGSVVIADFGKLRAMGSLSGKTVLVTRAPGQAGEFSTLLRARGAIVVEVPTIEIVPPESWEEADRAIDRLPAYDWLILTSANAVDRFFRRVRERRGDLACLAGVRICAVGPKTRAATEREGRDVAFQPSVFRAEGLIKEAGEGAWRGSRVLFPRAAEGRDVIPDEMRRLGAELEMVPVYRTVPSPAGRERLRALLTDGGLDAVTFTSGSTVKSFVSLLDPGQLAAIAGRVVVACIGPVTAAAAREAGLPVDALAGEATLPALADALEKRFGG
jgi:uroporphyrinogen III methyltransferase / synthase